MRHRKSGRHLNRTSAHRRAMFRNMAVSLIEHESIKTTIAKAKELRRVVEPLITLAKRDSVANRRLAFARIRSSAAVAKLFVELGPRYGGRPGGYTRILKCGPRSGDAAPMAYIELMDRSTTDLLDDAADEDAQPKALQEAPPAAGPTAADSGDPEAAAQEESAPDSAAPSADSGSPEK